MQCIVNITHFLPLPSSVPSIPSQTTVTFLLSFPTVFSLCCPVTQERELFRHIINLHCYHFIFKED